MQNARGRPFIKMHGLGNDFVVVDARREPFDLDAGAARRIADRREGVGCDQVIVMEPPRDPCANVFMRIRNADGSEVAACGNATRCVAARVMTERETREVTVETLAGLLHAKHAAEGKVAVDMGAARLDWNEIPLAREMDTLHLGLEADGLRDPVAVSVGNPHAVFFVDDAEAVELERVGPELEYDALFPERANISAAQVLDSTHIRLRVWERGAGITRACGTAACATAVAAVRRELTERKVTIALDGGELGLEWRAGDGHVIMTGPVAESFTGTLNGSLLAA
ncbi:diaminopimelate epimerase [Ferruginivarius sediminum]|uniref:Diaminopimelate epimerase n=1 Tax=Ferruginivarius sediminum TaxID=2661937 RepID=A0A369TE03_9PROT|nr:diaminopimelate epimerase [Ferruginivarius sediminum]RDD63500.1 diaminopimelate epimerase [Ferruginivarius sediminum]